MTDPVFLGRSRAEFDWAKRLIVCRYISHIGASVCVIAGLFTTSKHATAFGFAAVSFELLAFVLRTMTARAQSRAAKGLRYVLVDDSFGAMPAWVPGYLESELHFSRYAKSHASELADADYYESSAPKGTLRFSENLIESATYSHILCKRAADRIANRILATLPPLFLLVALSIAFATDATARMETAILGVVLTGVITSDIIGAMLQLADAADETKKVLVWFEFHKNYATDGDLFAISNDCVAALSSCPPIPTGDYTKHKPDIEAKLDQVKKSGGWAP